MQSIILKVDGNECSLEEFIQTNMVEDGVDHLVQDDIENIKKLDVGECLYFGQSTKVEMVKKAISVKFNNQVFDINQISRAIAIRRKQVGLTMQQLAEKLGTDKGYISRIEAGKINITLKYLALIANSLECDLEILMHPVK